MLNQKDSNEQPKGFRETLVPKGSRKKPIVFEGVFLHDKKEEKITESDELIARQLASFGFFSK